jgi:repressor-related protein
MLEIKSERRVKILLITSIQAKAIRRKQADKKLTAKQAGEEIGVTQVTYRKIRDGGEVKPFIYQKAMEWLAEDY